MGVQIGTCSVCKDEFEQSLINYGILNYDIARSRKPGKWVFTVNIAGSPKTWPKTSLRAMCWNQLELDFAYHASVRRGSMICCSNY